MAFISFLDIAVVNNPTKKWLENKGDYASIRSIYFHTHLENMYSIFPFWFPSWLKDCFFIQLNQIWQKHRMCSRPLLWEKFHNYLHPLDFFVSSCCPECCQSASQWRVTEDFSQRSGQPGLHEVLRPTEAAKSDGGKVGQHLQHLHRPTGQRYKGSKPSCSSFMCLISANDSASCVTSADKDVLSFVWLLQWKSVRTRSSLVCVYVPVIQKYIVFDVAKQV